MFALCLILCFFAFWFPATFAILNRICASSGTEPDEKRRNPEVLLMNNCAIQNWVLITRLKSLALSSSATKLFVPLRNEIGAKVSQLKARKTLRTESRQPEGARAVSNVVQSLKCKLINSERILIKFERTSKFSSWVGKENFPKKHKEPSFSSREEWKRRRKLPRQGHSGKSWAE